MSKPIKIEVVRRQIVGTVSIGNGDGAPPLDALMKVASEALADNFGQEDQLEFTFEGMRVQITTTIAADESHPLAAFHSHELTTELQRRSDSLKM